MRFGSAVAIISALCVAITLGITLVPNRAPAQDQRARHLHSYTWSMAKIWFGGFSGIEVAPDGMSALILGDRSTLVQVRLQRDGGRITGVAPQNVTHLHSSAGTPLKTRIIDSEGLATGPNGEFYVSFEGVHRVARYDSPDAPARVLTTAPLFHGLGLNKSLEALARDDRGVLYAIPEGHDAQNRIPVFRGKGLKWEVGFYLPSRGKYLPVGADFGPDGRFYLLERDVAAFGFRSRLRRWTLTPSGPQHEETLFTTAAGTHDNLEGVSIWRDARGNLRATMISDDNFLFLQNTELVEYILPK